MKKLMKKKPALNELKLSSLNKQQLNQVIGGEYYDYAWLYGYAWLADYLRRNSSPPGGLQPDPNAIPKPPGPVIGPPTVF